MMSYVASIVIGTSDFKTQVCKKREKVSDVVPYMAEGFTVWIMESYWDEVQREVNQEKERLTPVPVAVEQGEHVTDSGTSSLTEAAVWGSKYSSSIKGKMHRNSSTKLHGRKVTPEGFKRYSKLCKMVKECRDEEDRKKRESERAGGSFESFDDWYQDQADAELNTVSTGKRTGSEFLEQEHEDTFVPNGLAENVSKFARV